MNKKDIEKGASGSSVMLSAMAFMISMLAMVAYFMFRATSSPQKASTIPTEKNYCLDNLDDKEAFLKKLSDLKVQVGDKWSSLCQDKLDGVLYDTAIIKAAEGKFNSSFMRLCQIPERRESEYFEEAKFLFSVWEKNRNTSGEPQEIKPLLESFFKDYKKPSENCPAAKLNFIR